MPEPTPKPTVVRQGDAVLLQTPGPGWLELEPETVAAIAAHASEPEMPPSTQRWLRLVLDLNILGHRKLSDEIVWALIGAPHAVPQQLVEDSSDCEERVRAARHDAIKVNRGALQTTPLIDHIDLVPLVELFEASLRRDLPADCDRLNGRRAG